MSKTNQPSEQRQHRRFEVPTSSFVSNNTVMGQIMDVSIGGLAFCYIGKEFTDGSYLDVFAPEHDFHLNKVPCKAVGDFEIRNKVLSKIGDTAPAHFKTMRRGSVEFCELSPGQRSQLKDFLQEVGTPLRI